MRKAYRDVATEFLNTHHPDARCAFIAGSMLRGEETPTSDIDLMILYGDDYRTPHRNSLIFQEWMIETFVQNPKSLAFFIREDIQSGCATTLDMVINGQAFGDIAYADTIKQRALEKMKQGPARLSSDAIDQRRYFITDLLDDWRGAKSIHESHATLAKLYEKLGDFHLRAHGNWSGSGKWILRAMRRTDADLASRYGDAFAKALSDQHDALETLAHELLAPFGGENRTWKSSAPDGWKDESKDFEL